MNVKSWKWPVLVLAAFVLGSLGAPVLARAEEPEAAGQVGALDTYSQLDAANGQTLTSTDSPASTDYKAADDVAVPGGSTWWLVSTVTVDGQMIAGTPSLVLVEFYADVTNSLSFHVPGTLLSSQSGNVTSGASTGDFVISLPNVVALRPGQTYWLAVQARTDSISTIWRWGTRNTQTGFASAYNSTGLAGCINEWQPRVVCDSTPGPDLLFALTYSPFTPTNFVNLPIIRR